MRRDAGPRRGIFKEGGHAALLEPPNPLRDGPHAHGKAFGRGRIAPAFEQDAADEQQS